MKIQNTPYFSKRVGRLPKGCRQCVQGRKLVLFVTGVCARKCWFCPLSEQKMKKDVIFANEWQLDNENDTKKIIKEAELCGSKGAGITGGDPFSRLERTLKYIRLLKRKFGKEFHIHLYAPLNNITEDKLKKLYKAGLDELRIHPDFDSKRYWENVWLLRKFDWDLGMEIPAIPGKETKQVLDFFCPYMDFLNLNELEISDTNMDEILKRKLKPKDQYSYAVKGSEELALKLMKYCIKKFPDLRIHFCTTKLKDAVQLAKRLKLRAKNAKTKFDKVTSEGMLIRNCIYLDELKPGFGYRKKLNKALKKKNNYLKKLNSIKKNLKKIGMESIIDELKLRLLVNRKDLRRIDGEGISKAVVEEYPTSDGMEVEVDFK